MQGQIGERALFRSVYKHIRRHDKTGEPETIGHDYSVGSLPGIDHEMITAAAYAVDPVHAWHIAMNHFAMSGGICTGARIALLLPEFSTEADVKQTMQVLNALADRDGVQLLAVDSLVVEHDEQPCCGVTAVGIREMGALSDVSHVKPGDEIVQVGYTGLLATSQLYQTHRAEFESRFNRDFVADAIRKTEIFDVRPAVRHALSCGADVYALKNIGFGGVFGALWQLAAAANCGVTADREQMPILQETIEAAEYFQINPYEMRGDGSFLVIAPDGEAVASHMREAGFEAPVVGVLTDGKDRILKDTNRFLTSVEEDGLYKVSGIQI